MPLSEEQVEKLLTDNCALIQQQALWLTNNQAIMTRQAELIEQLSLAANVKPVLEKERPELTIESLANTIEQFSFDPESNSTFETWYSRYEDVFLEDAKILSDPAKVRLLMRKLDLSAHDRYSNFILPDTPKEKTFIETTTILKQIFAKPDSLFCSRWKCLQTRKDKNEDFTSYAAKVNRACEDFKLGELKADQFKSLIFILGLSDASQSEIRSKLLNKMDTEHIDGINLNQLIKECNRIANLKRDTKLGVSQKETPIMAVKKSGKSKAFNKPKKNDSAPRTFICWYCGLGHRKGECKYTNHCCRDCGVVGHLEGLCNSKWKGFQKNKTAKIVTINNKNFVNRTVIVNNVTNGSRKFVDVTINGKICEFQFDSAADITIMSLKTWNTIDCPELMATDIIPVDAQKNKLSIKGILVIDIELRGITKRGRIFVADIDSDLLGIETIELFDLWNIPPSKFCKQIGKAKRAISHETAIAELKEKYSNVFSPTLGACNKMEAKLQLIPNAKPVFRPKRPVPFHIMSQVEEELQRLQHSGIISPVEFSQFAAPIVVVRKPNGKIRICADYSTGLNDALLPHQYPIPTPEQIFATLANCSVFSQIDLSDAYLQLKVDNDSKKLLTINTHLGLFTMNRLCPGVKPASGIFQQLMDTMFAGLENNVSTFFDDILVATSNEDEHKIVLEEVFRRLQDYNLRARLDKCRLFQKEIKFLGVKIDENGQKPDKSKIEAIQSMPSPSNVAELRSFLGAISFYGRFIKSMSALREPLDRLLKKDTPFNWSQECENAFNKFKELLNSNLMLTHYDPALPITVAADASQKGIGAVAYHTFPDGSIKAFHHASRRLTDTEQRYSQIEKEALAIIFGVKKFHQYIFGRKITICTDHKPLLSIFGSRKGIPAHTANRLQRWALTLLCYDFEIKFIGTNEFGHADLLSRLIADRPSNTEDQVIAAIEMEDDLLQLLSDDIDAAIPVSFIQIGLETEKDPVLKEVSKYITDGWPSSRKAIVSREVQKFYNFKDSLSIIKNCIIFRDRTVVPLRFRRKILAQLHSSHPGMSRMIALARSYVFWPGIDDDVRELVKRCNECSSHAKLPTKTTLSSWPIPTGPWERVHADFAGPINQESYLILIDSFSKWPEVFPMTRTTTEMTVKKIREACARLGTMSTLVTDNGPQFTSDSFELFCKENNINHVKTPPYHPQSNGQVERFVGTFKRALEKSRGKKESFVQNFLQNYRATPNESAPNGLSPAELIYNRKMRLPINAVLPQEDITTKRNEKMEQQFNKKHGAKKRVFQRGDDVRVQLQPKGFWIKSQILQRIGTVIYLVRTVTGIERRVHINQVLPYYKEEQDQMEAGTSRADQKEVVRRTPPVLRPRT